MASSKGLHPNLNAVLDTIAYAEGTSTSPITLDDGYDIIVTGVDGKERFSDYSAHPFSNGRKAKKINENGLYSTASGRYQFMLVHYGHYRKLLGLKDFGPESQDKWAIQLIKERKAIPYILEGKIEEAFRLISNLWASFPGAGYGQPERKLEKLIEVYLSKGGKLWDSKLSSEQLLRESSQLSEPSLQVVSEPEQKPKPQLQPIEQEKMPQGWLNLLKNLLRRK